ncbi:MAG: hypothetical protein AAFX85_14190 [Pseudomonadota bacterium]
MTQAHEAARRSRRQHLLAACADTRPGAEEATTGLDEVQAHRELASLLIRLDVDHAPVLWQA